MSSQSRSSAYPIPVTLEIKWKSEMHLIDVGHIDEICVAEVKHELFSVTEVLPYRQKLLFKGKTWKDDETLDSYLKDVYGKESSKMAQSKEALDDGAEGKGDNKIGDSNGTDENCTNPQTAQQQSSSSSSSSKFVQTLKLGQISMLGSRETDLAFILEPPESEDNEENEVNDDFDDDGNDLNLNNNGKDGEEFPDGPLPQDQLKIQKRIEKADEYITVLQPPTDPRRKLLMLDIDYTFFDHRSPADNAEQLRRPYLHEFLTAVYNGKDGICPGFDIGIWSATSRKWIDVKLLELGLINSPSYKISVIMDARSMISINSKKYGGVVRIKPLDVLWGYAKSQGYGEFYHSGNTIMFDDLRRNMCLNSKQGLKIRPFRNGPSAEGRADRELVKLEQYLLSIGSLGEGEFRKLNHKKWEQYIGLKKRKTG